MRKQQTVWKCDRCGFQVVGPVGARKAPDGWQLGLTLPLLDPDSTSCIVVPMDLCGECTGNLARWLVPVEV